MSRWQPSPGGSQHPPPALPRVEAAEVGGEGGVEEREDVLERAERVGLALPAAELLGEHGEVGLPVLDRLDPALEVVDEGLKVVRRRLVFQGGVEALGELSIGPSISSSTSRRTVTSRSGVTQMRYESKAA